jgi:outer membrane receptor protein involved in Fe transport
LTYKLDSDRLLYATYSEGFRVGGSNPLKPASALPRDYKSDELKNYEVGLKSEWLDHRLRLNMSAYYMEWDNFSVQVEDPQPAVFQLGFVNLPTADIKGIETELAVTFNQQWQLDGALSSNDAKTAEASTLSVTDEDGNVFTFAVSKDARLPISPDWSGSLGLEFRPDMRLLEAQPCPSCATDCNARLLEARDARRFALAARARFRARDERLARRKADRDAARAPMPSAAAKAPALPPSAAG